MAQLLCHKLPPGVAPHGIAAAVGLPSVSLAQGPF